jgi:hypothetical protein
VNPEGYLESSAWIDWRHPNVLAKARDFPESTNMFTTI